MQTLTDQNSPVETMPEAGEIEIHPMRTAVDTNAFRTLNEEWIERFFSLEESDRQVLGDPKTAILEKGGLVFIAAQDHEPVGCVALVPLEDGMYELAKMAVAPRLRGLGIGRKLLEHAVSQARQIGARSLILGSSTKLPNAVHLYESIGFRHVPVESLPPTPYARTDVHMAMSLLPK